HFYTWAFVGQTALIAYCALMMLLEARAGAPVTPTGPSVIARWATWAFVAAVALPLGAGWPARGVGPFPSYAAGALLAGHGRARREVYSKIIVLIAIIN